LILFSYESPFHILLVRLILTKGRRAFHLLSCFWLKGCCLRGRLEVEVYAPLSRYHEPESLDDVPLIRYHEPESLNDVPLSRKYQPNGQEYAPLSREHEPQNQNHLPVNQTDSPHPERIQIK